MVSVFGRQNKSLNSKSPDLNFEIFIQKKNTFFSEHKLSCDNQTKHLKCQGNSESYEQHCSYGSSFGGV